jgi:hypothetical protein
LGHKTVKRALCALLSALLILVSIEAFAARLLSGRGGGTGGAGPQAFTSITLDNSSWTVTGSVANVGNVQVPLSPSSPTFTGTLALGTGAGCADSTNFQLLSSTLPAALQAKAATVAGTYSQVCIIATQSGLTGNPKTQVLAMITGNASGGAASCTPGPGVLCPLQGGAPSSSLVTTNSGTLTFPGSSGWYGFDVNSGGSALLGGMQAVAICTAANGVCANNVSGSAPRTFFKFRSQLETPTWQRHYCLADSLAQVGTTSTAPTGANLTDRLGNVYAWAGGTSPNYNINLNGAGMSTGDQMILADDGMVYFSQNIGGTPGIYWWGLNPTTGWSNWAGVRSPVSYAAGTLRAVAACPSGL